jgi:hypothetical protein
MHLALTAFLIFYSGWTLAVHLGLLLGLELSTVLGIFVVLTLSLLRLHRFLRNTEWPLCGNSPTALRSLCFWDASSGLQPLLILLIAFTAMMHWSWNAFLMFAILALFATLLRRDEIKSVAANSCFQAVKKNDTIVIILSALTLIVLSYAISRSDLDDAFYAAVAAFASSNPAHALKMDDPMLGEIGLPLIFPSYRFASFELLSGAGGYLFSVPAMDFYYIYLLPIWVVASVLVIFLLTRELIPKYWVGAGCLTLVLTLLLGEMHRSPANFSFVRLFQGKAVFLSVLVPAIFYLTARYLSDRGKKADLLLLGCCQISSVGLTNFGMLMGPIAGFSALISNVLLLRSGSSKKFLYALAVLFIPLPYLIIVALESSGSPVMELGSESAANVWLSVFGSHQQYLVGVLLLAGPVLAKESLTRWRLAIPPFFLYAIFLNPVLSEFISKYITTPAVYWRVVWSFPILIFSAISLRLIIFEIMDRRFKIFVRVLLVSAVFLAVIYSLPFNTLRKENIGPIDGFAGWKIPQGHLRVAEIAMSLVRNNGRLLAPDEVAGVVSRFEHHPKLISTRGFYLSWMQPSLSPSEYKARFALYSFIVGNVIEDGSIVRDALRALDVSVIVLNLNAESRTHLETLRNANYNRHSVIDVYAIWIRNTAHVLSSDN